MTSRAARAGRAAALLAAAGLACGGCSLLPALPPARPRPARPRRPPLTASPQPTAAAAPLASLLPFPPARLQAAAGLAGRFTAAWDSWSWRQPPAAWLAALQPMAAASLEPALAQAAGDRGVLAQRAADRQSAVADRDRPGDPGPDPRLGHRHRHRRPGHHGQQRHQPHLGRLGRHPHPGGSGWLVWDIEPAGAGNS